ncbi:MAG: SDR family NAD(P)-dependent oxidoreductase [Cyclobacteriaceae bacterium]
MNQTVIIGGSSGIGNALAQKLSSSGVKVCATYHNTKPQANGNNIQFHQLDVLNDEADLSFLPEQIDGLVYCPGAIDLRPISRIKPKEFIDDFNLQVVGAIKIIQAALPKLKKSGSPSIVLFSTVAVQMGFPSHTKVAASKGAIEGLGRSLAAELAPKIRVNVIAPSITDTPMAAGLLNSVEKKEANAARHPLKKIGDANQIASVAEFLLSDKANWITGQVLHIDGGISNLKV